MAVTGEVGHHATARQTSESALRTGELIRGSDWIKEKRDVAMDGRMQTREDG